MNSKTTPKDFFLHLGAVLALYISAGALINLIFTIINYSFSDALTNYFSASSIAWPISVLIILVPILYGLEWLIQRDIDKIPEKKEIWVRRWRIYLTIFLMVVLVGGDLIVLINTYLNGEVTARFIWKVIAILLIAGSIGKYYFYSMYPKFRHANLIRRGNAWFGVVLVLGAIVGGFLVVGSPATQRALRLDSQRIGDLESLESEIVDYWQQQGRLPANLGSLVDSVSVYELPMDPELLTPYEYGIVATTSLDGAKTVNTSFRLCATFDRASTDPNGGQVELVYPGGQPSSWAHAAGHVCFDRTIDPSLHPVNQKIQPM